MGLIGSEVRVRRTSEATRSRETARSVGRISEGSSGGERLRDPDADLGCRKVDTHFGRSLVRIDTVARGRTRPRRVTLLRAAFVRARRVSFGVSRGSKFARCPTRQRRNNVTTGDRFPRGNGTQPKPHRRAPVECLLFDLAFSLSLYLRSLLTTSDVRNRTT